MLVIFFGGPNNAVISDAYGIDGLPDRLDAEPKGAHQTSGSQGRRDR